MIDFSPGMYTVNSRGGLGRITRVGKGPGGAIGAWVADATGDPGAGYGHPIFAPDWCIRLAVVGDTVCLLPRGTHFCGLQHVSTADLDRLRAVGQVKA